MKIVFFGSSKYSLIGAKIIHESLGICLIVTVPQSPLEKFVAEKNIPFLSVKKLSEDVIGKIAQTKPDFFVVEDYGLILPETLLNLPKFASLNIHHSLLPKYRGPSPAPSAILAGEKVSGVSIIQMTNKVDAGDIYAQKEYALKPNETTESLLTELNTLGAELITSVIKNIEAGETTATKQDESKATKTTFMQKKNGFIDLDNLPGREKFDRMVRAFYPWPGVWTQLRLSSAGQAKIIKFLPNKQIQVEGKKPLSYKDFLNGYQNLNPKLLSLLR